MSNSNDPAYPQPGGPWHGCNGLTKREHFAALAMQGMLSCSDYSQTSTEKLAEVALKVADALLKELAK